MPKRRALALILPLFAAACSSEPTQTSTSGSGGSSADAHGSGGAGGTVASGGTSATGATGGGDAEAGVVDDLCSSPSGNFFAHGEFEEGMDGLAPTGWEVRNPDAPTTCAGSGTPSEHVFLSDPPPGCPGKALAIDARGQWDCYAIQRVSDYGSIEGGATYRVSAVVKSSGNSVNPAAWFVVGVQWLDANDAFFGDEKNPKTATAAENDYDWKRLSFDLVAPANARRILVWLSGHYPGRVDFDNVSVVKL